MLALNRTNQVSPPTPKQVSMQVQLAWRRDTVSTNFIHPTMTPPHCRLDHLRIIPDPRHMAMPLWACSTNKPVQSPSLWTGGRTTRMCARWKSTPSTLVSVVIALILENPRQWHPGSTTITITTNAGLMALSAPTASTRKVATTTLPPRTMEDVTATLGSPKALLAMDWPKSARLFGGRTRTLMILTVQSLAGEFDHLDHRSVVAAEADRETARV
ncbi:hypothetical protein HDK64DRAFT_277803 [Phyllosticta capitalensis]